MTQGLEWKTVRLMERYGKGDGKGTMDCMKEAEKRSVKPGHKRRKRGNKRENKGMRRRKLRK